MFNLPALIETMFNLPALIETMFEAAGWQPQAAVNDVPSAQASTQIATEIVRQFGGLRVGEAGPGTQQAASDISFYAQLRPEVSAVTQPWRQRIGNCLAFATAHNDHMILFVNDQGLYFTFMDPDEQLYELGRSFGHAMNTLLFGYDYGAPLARDR